MELQQNVSAVLKAIQTSRHKNLTEFSEELEISRSHLHEILTQKANPRIDTIEHIANKLGIDPAALISFSFEDAQLQVIDHLLKLIGAMDALSPEKRLTVAKLFLEIVRQWDSDDDCGNL